MNLIISFIIDISNLYLYMIIATVLISWLVAFDVLNMRNKGVYKVCMLLNRAVDPPIRLVRRVLPPVGGIDFAPMVVMFGIILLQHVLTNLLYY